MTMAKAKTAKAKKAIAKKPVAKRRKYGPIFTKPVGTLTLEELRDAGVLNEKNKVLGKEPYRVAVYLSDEDIARIAEAIGAICKVGE
jgi:hypothetical protein